MIDLKNRKIFPDGTVICTESAAVDILYKGYDLKDVILDDSELTTQFNKSNELLDYNFEMLNSGIGPQYENINWYNQWVTPNEFNNINVNEYCLSKCTTPEQIDRVNFEMQLFEERNMIQILKNLMWLVDHFKKNNILWGVGRGSCVSSYVLYIIGINRIDPLKYNLDIREFLR